MKVSLHTDLKPFIQNEIIKNIKKLRGKHAPISEIVSDVPKILTVEKVYDLREMNKNFFLFIVKNYSKTPKLRYFLAISLAHNSSDLLVQLARDFAVRNDLKLIQYSIFPKNFRIQLLLLKEIEKAKDYTSFIEILKTYRRQFRHKLERIKNLVENE